MITFNSKKVKNMIENKIEHPYVQRYIAQPFIDIDKIAALLMIYDEVANSKQHKYEEIVSIMLVQTALDTHDLVTNDTTLPTDDLERQLTVLAGDFYSGLYYRTLAEIDEIALVRSLANAIKLINEQKMVLYEFELISWQQLMKTLQVIESILFTNVARLHSLSQVDIEYISEYLLVNRLMREIESIEQNEFSYIHEYVKRNLVDPYEPSVVYSIEREIAHRCKRMNELKTERNFSLEGLTNIIDDKKMLSAVEEG